MGCFGSKRKGKEEDEELQRVASTSMVCEDDPTGRRMDIAREFLSTERTYVESLDLCVRLYLHPLREPAKKPIVKPKDVSVIFSNLEEILSVHTDVLRGLEERLEEPAPTIGALFAEIADQFKCYTTYINNYNDAISTLVALQAKKKAFSEFNKQRLEMEECMGLSLPAFLIMPVQRLPRYVLLLQDLNKNTVDNHIDKEACLQALDSIREVADYVNEEKRIIEDMQECAQLQDAISDCPAIVVRGRRVVQDGEIRIEDRKKGEREMHFYLFNDMLMLCVAEKASALKTTLHLFHLSGNSEVRYRYVESQKLMELQLEDCKDRHDRANFACLRFGKAKEYMVCFEDATQKKEWMEKFYSTRAHAPA